MGVSAVAILVTAAVGGLGKAGVPALGFFVVFYVLISWLLLKGNRVVWVLVVASGVLELLTAPFSGSAWWTAPLALFHLVLLFAPSSFDYVWDRPLPFRRIRPGT